MMNSLADTIAVIRSEIDLGEQCLTNILARLDEDIARITERKQQIKDEFAARRLALETIIGEKASTTEQEATDDATN